MKQADPQSVVTTRVGGGSEFEREKLPRGTPHVRRQFQRTAHRLPIQVSLLEAGGELQRARTTLCGSLLVKFTWKCANGMPKVLLAI